MAGRRIGMDADRDATEGDTRMAGPPAHQPDDPAPQTPPAGGAPSQPTGPADAAGGFSQEDIDAALAAAADDGTEASTAVPQAASPRVEAGAASSASEPHAEWTGDDAAADPSAGEPAEQVHGVAGRISNAMPAGRAATEPLPPPPSGAVPLELPDFSSRSGEVPGGIAMLSDVKLNVKIELGRAEMLIDEVLKLSEGSVVELDKLAGDPVDVLVNERLVARGEVLVLNDNFCVRISQILSGAGMDDD